MAEHTITLTAEQEAAGLAILGSVEAVEAELQTIVNYTAGPWVTKYNADKEKTKVEAATALADKYAKLEKADQDAVDAILAKAAVVSEEPVGG
jgi:hypothetical protein